MESHKYSSESKKKKKKKIPYLSSQNGDAFIIDAGLMANSIKTPYVALQQTIIELIN